MEKSPSPKPSYSALTATGLMSKSYAAELAYGLKTPSLAMARKIEQATGYPMSAWQLREKA